MDEGKPSGQKIAEFLVEKSAEELVDYIGSLEENEESVSLLMVVHHIRTEKVVIDAMIRKLKGIGALLLISALKDTDPEKRSWAAFALGKLSFQIAECAVGDLVASLNDDNNNVVSAASRALIKITGKRFLFGNKDPSKWKKWLKEMQFIIEPMTNNAVEYINGPSKYWACPQCKAVLQKSMQGMFGPGTNISGASTCGSCGANLQQRDVYRGKYDLDEVKLQCPQCSTWLQGPGINLLGKACPACNSSLPEE